MEHAFENTGINPGQLSDETLRVSSSQILLVFKNISDGHWHPHLPFEIGQQIHISAYGLYGYAVLCSERYRDTVAFAEKYHYLAAPTVSMKFNYDAGVEGWDLEPLSSTLVDQDFYPFLVNLQIGIHASLHEDIFGAEFASHLIELRYPANTFYKLPKKSAVEIRYGTKRNRLHVHSQWIDYKPRLGNDLTFRQIVKICEKELAELTQQGGVTGQVKKVFVQQARFPANMETVAQELGLNSRTLRRYLKRENTTFTEIVDSVRADLAVRYLREARLSNEEIAFVIGFSEASSFVRAFKRWTGKTPGQFRVSR